MTRRRTGYEMVIDMMRIALHELDAAATPEDPHLDKARDVLDDAIYLAEINSRSLKK